MEIVEKPEGFLRKSIVMFVSVAALVFLSGVLNEFVVMSIHSGEFSEFLSGLPDFILSSVMLAVPLTIIGLLLFFLYEYIDTSKYLKISSYAAALTSLPLLSFILSVVPKNPTLMSSTSYCAIYRNGLLTPCGVMMTLLDLLGSVLTVAVIVLVKNVIFPKVEAK
ncbi:MAG: hypothetical protein IOD01_14570 [Rhodobacter sp.]|nr:hypothetical protein [Rhodobacter sp.]